MRKYVSIQYLRGLAAVLVVGAHAIHSPNAILGGSGVDIFFVISGFIMWTLTAERETTPLKFLRRRISRIVPLYWGFTALLVGGFLAIPSAFPHFQFTWSELLYSLGFIPFHNTTNDQVRPVLQQGWTLNYEMMYYVIMAFALQFQSNVRLAVVAGALLLMPAVGLFVPHESALGNNMTNPLIIEFLAGIGIAILASTDRLPSPAMAAGMLALAGAGYLIAAVYVGEEGPPYRVISWGLPGALLVLGMLTLEQKTNFQQSPLLLLVGDASYSIYLSHTFTISIANKVAGLLHAGPEFKDSGLMSLIVIPACVLGGIAVYWVFERPLLGLGKRQQASVSGLRQRSL